MPPLNVDGISPLPSDSSGNNRRAGQEAFPPIRLDRCNTLRSISILGVFIYHIFSTQLPYSSQSFSAAISHLFAPLRALAGFAVIGLFEAYHLVIVFFVFSGYFLHQAFLRWHRRNPDEGIGAFTEFLLWRRFWRLVVPFWFALLVSYFLDDQHPFSARSLKTLAINAMLLKTLIPGYFFTINYAHWYIAVQWQLDLLYPLFLYMMLRRSFFTAFAVAGVTAFIFSFLVPHFTLAPYVFNLPFRWWAEWTAGAFLAEMHAQHRRVFTHPWWCGLACILGIAAAVGLRSEMIAWVFLRVAIILVLEVFLLSGSPLKRIERWLAPVGLCSYSMYLLHLPVIIVAMTFYKYAGFPFNTLASVLGFTVVAFALTFAVSWAAYRYIEQPSVKFGGRMWRKLLANREAPASPRPAAQGS